MKNESHIELALKKNKRLSEILNEMSVSSTDYAKVIDEFAQIYNGEFRHSYAVISECLYKMDSDERDIVSESLKYIVEKLIEFEKKQSNDKEYAPLIKGVTKLKDHIDLEILRIQLDAQADERLRSAVSKSELIKENTDELQQELDYLRQEVWKVESQTESSNTQSITILSIFAGIVFVFTGGFSLISTALQNINNASIYKLTFILSLVGIVMFDLVLLFFYMIAKLTNKNISSSCIKTHSSVCDWEDVCQNCKLVKRYCRRFYYVIIPNAIFILLMIVSVVIWFIRRG